MATSVLQASELAFGPQHDTIEKLELRSNHGATIDASVIGWLEPTSPNMDLGDMRRRFVKQGYLFVKGLVPREDVLDVREEYFNHLKPTGIINDGVSPRKGIFNNSASIADHNGIGSPDELLSTDDRSKLLVDAHTNPKYLELVSHPSLRTFIHMLMGWRDDFLLPRTMIRHAVPGGLSTGIHYDQIYLRGGDPLDEFLTAWVPLGDITADGGGLIYLSDSVGLGRALEADFTERAAQLPAKERISAFNVNMSRTGALSMDAHQFYDEIVTREGAGKHKWLTANYEAGDVIFFGPYLIHAAAMNNDRHGSIRLSTDLRFYNEGAKIDKRWLKNWTLGDGL